LLVWIAGSLIVGGVKTYYRVRALIEHQA